MTLIHTKKGNMKHKTSFKFNRCTVHYHIPNRADVYYETDDTEYNKWINQLFLDLWYKRLKLLKSSWIIEVSLGFEFAWRGIYYRDDELYLADKERRDNIRKVPPL